MPNRLAARVTLRSVIRTSKATSRLTFVERILAIPMTYIESIG
jgi:hypothetical protein